MSPKLLVSNGWAEGQRHPPTSGLRLILPGQQECKTSWNTHCDEGVIHSCKNTRSKAIDSAKALIIPDMWFPRPASMGTKTRYFVGFCRDAGDPSLCAPGVSALSDPSSARTPRKSKLYRSVAYASQNLSESSWKQPQRSNLSVTESSSATESRERRARQQLHFHEVHKSCLPQPQPHQAGIKCLPGVEGSSKEGERSTHSCT